MAPSEPHGFELVSIIHDFLHAQAAVISLKADPIRGSRQFMGQFTMFIRSFKDIRIEFIV